MGLYNIRKRLQESRNIVESDGVASLPGVMLNDFKYDIIGVFNDIKDETAFTAWGFKVDASEDRAVGEVCFGSRVADSPFKQRNVGKKLIAQIDSSDFTVYVVGIRSPRNMYSTEDELIGARSFSFDSFGGNYPSNLRKIVDYLRMNLRK